MWPPPYRLTQYLGFLFQEASTIGKYHPICASLRPVENFARVAVLSPPSCSKFLSYLTGWITVIAWQAGMASGAFFGGTMIQGLLVLNYENYVFHRWHGTLLLYAIVAFSLFVNTFLARVLPKIEAMVLVIQVL